MILQCSLRTCCAKHHLKRKLLVLQWIWQVQEIHFAETKREVLFLQRESSSLGSCVLIVEISPLEGFSHSHPSTPFHHIVSSKSPVLLQSAWEQQTHWTSGIRINMHGMECHAAFVADVFFVAVRSRWASCVCACLPTVTCMHWEMHLDIYACPCVCGCSLPPPSGGQWGDGGPLRWDAADLHVGEGAPSLAAAVRDRGRGGDNVLQPVEGDDEQRQQEHQQAEEKPHININVARTSWRWGRRWRGRRGRGEAEEGPIVDWRDSGLIMVYQRDVHPWHPGWSSA